MTNQSYEQRIEEAAKEFADQNCAPFEKLSYFDCAHGFARGVKWCRENPPPEFVLRSDVEALITEVRLSAGEQRNLFGTSIEPSFEWFYEKYPKGDEK